MDVHVCGRAGCECGVHYKSYVMYSPRPIMIIIFTSRDIILTKYIEEIWIDINIYGTKLVSLDRYLNLGFLSTIISIFVHQKEHHREATSSLHIMSSICDRRCLIVLIGESI